MTVEWHFPLRTFFGTHCVMNDRHIFAHFCIFLHIYAICIYTLWHSWKWGVLKYLDELCICTSGRLNLCSSFQHSSLRGVMNDLLREHSLHLNFNQTDFQWAKFLTFEPLNLELQTCGPKIIFSSHSTQSQKVSRHIIIWRIGTLIFQSPYLRAHSSKLPWKMFLVRGVQPFSQKPSLGGKFSPLPKKLYTHKEFSSCQQKERLYNGSSILDQISYRSWGPETFNVNFQMTFHSDQFWQKLAFIRMFLPRPHLAKCS